MISFKNFYKLLTEGEVFKCYNKDKFGVQEENGTYYMVFDNGNRAKIGKRLFTKYYKRYLELEASRKTNKDFKEVSQVFNFVYSNPRMFRNRENEVCYCFTRNYVSLFYYNTETDKCSIIRQFPVQSKQIIDKIEDVLE